MIGLLASTMHPQLPFVVLSFLFGLVSAFSIPQGGIKTERTLQSLANIDAKTASNCQDLWKNMTVADAWQTFFPRLDYPFTDEMNVPFRSMGSCCLCCICNITSVCQEYHITQECCHDPAIYINCCTIEKDLRNPNDSGYGSFR